LARERREEGIKRRREGKEAQKWANKIKFAVL
jgi:hypothetical protein